jgi:hypothetical protein
VFQTLNSLIDGLMTPTIATHDSIGLGEDGPTHQPIETAIHLRAIPNLDFWRPADGNETSAAYAMALKRNHTPSVLSLSSGSEVSIAVEAAKKLKAEGVKTRVVSLPCWSVFDQQSEEYKLSILRSGAPILSLEALSVCEPFLNLICITDLCFFRLPDGRNTVTSSMDSLPGVRPDHTRKSTRNLALLGPVRVYETFTFGFT